MDTKLFYKKDSYNRTLRFTSDGLDLYRQLFAQISNSSNPPKNYHKPYYVFTESLPAQHQLLEKIALDAGYKL